MSTFKVAQFSEDDFFSGTVSREFMDILLTIRNDHDADVTIADETGTETVKNALDQATHFEGSAEEGQVVLFLSQLDIKYSKITKDEFVTLMGILRKSDKLKTSGKNGRGKGKKNKHKKQVRTH